MYTIERIQEIAFTEILGHRISADQVPAENQLSLKFINGLKSQTKRCFIYDLKGVRGESLRVLRFYTHHNIASNDYLVTEDLSKNMRDLYCQSKGQKDLAVAHEAASRMTSTRFYRCSQLKSFDELVQMGKKTFQTCKFTGLPGATPEVIQAWVLLDFWHSAFVKSEFVNPVEWEPNVDDTLSDDLLMLDIPRAKEETPYDIFVDMQARAEELYMNSYGYNYTKNHNPNEKLDDITVGFNISTNNLAKFQKRPGVYGQPMSAPEQSINYNDSGDNEAMDSDIRGRTETGMVLYDSDDDHGYIALAEPPHRAIVLYDDERPVAAPSKKVQNKPAPESQELSYPPIMDDLDDIDTETTLPDPLAEFWAKQKGMNR